MLSLEQLEIRKTGLGGSDAPVVMGLSPWTTQSALWERKTGNEKPMEDLPQRLWIGNMVEPAIIKMFREQSGLNVAIDEETKRSEDHPFMIGHVDAFVYEGELEQGIELHPGQYTAIVEAKFTNPYSFRKQWFNGPPAMYIAQVQHLMYVTGLSKSYICVLVGNEAFHYYEVNRNDSYIKRLIEAEERFWKLVQDETPPYLWETAT